MSEETAPERISVAWSPEARSDLRAIERETAMQILYCIDRYLASRAGDVKRLKPPLRRPSRVLRSEGRKRRRDHRSPQPQGRLPLT